MYPHSLCFRTPCRHCSHRLHPKNGRLKRGVNRSRIISIANCRNAQTTENEEPFLFLIFVGRGDSISVKGAERWWKDRVSCAGVLKNSMETARKNKI